MKKTTLLVLLLAFVATGCARKSEQTVKDCRDFGDKLEKCEPFKCKYKYPITGWMLERHIVGKVGEKCHYIEEFPKIYIEEEDKWKEPIMECMYSSKLRKEIAAFYKRGFLAAAFSGENPIAKANDSGECVVFDEEGNKIPFGLKAGMVAIGRDIKDSIIDAGGTVEISKDGSSFKVRIGVDKGLPAGRCNKFIDCPKSAAGIQQACINHKCEDVGCYWGSDCRGKDEICFEYSCQTED